MELTADYSLPGLQEQSGVHFSVEGNQVKGVLIADLSTIQGERFAIEALIARQWIVDGIEAYPPEALADRTLLPSSAGQQLLRLNLTRPVNAARHLQLILRAHTRRPPNGRSIPEGFFSLANFSDVRGYRRLVHLQIDEPGSEFTFAGEGGLQQRDPKDLTASDLQLFESPPSGLVVEINDAEQAIRGTLTQATARYRAADRSNATRRSSGGTPAADRFHSLPARFVGSELVARAASAPAS